MTMQKQGTQNLELIAEIWKNVLLDSILTHLNLRIFKYFIVGDESKPNAV
jgi:hypothetical protein